LVTLPLPEAGVAALKPQIIRQQMRAAILVAAVAAVHPTMSHRLPVAAAPAARATRAATVYLFPARWPETLAVAAALVAQGQMLAGRFLAMAAVEYRPVLPGLR
jgi:hypothetical protein